MMMKTLFLLLFLVQDPADVYRHLDEGNDEAIRKYTADQLIGAIRKGRPVKDGEPFENQRRLTDAFGGETDLYLIVPEKPRGAILLLHGLGGNGTQLKDRLFNKFAAQEGLIIACPTAQKEPEGARNEDCPDAFLGNRATHWWSYREGGFAIAALQQIKREFGIDENRVILAGYSMGGFGAWNLGLRYPDRFAALVPMAGGISRGEYMNRRGDKRMRRLLLNAFHVPAYFIHGDADQTVPVQFDRNTRDQLKEYGTEHRYVEVPKGRHLLEVGQGGEIMNGIQAWLKDKRRDAHPRTVKHYAIGSYAALSYWLRIDELADKNAEVTAEIKGNAIEVKSTGAKKLTLFLDEKHIDLSKPVKVTVNGKQAFSGKVEPSVDVVLESWKLREDRELLYRAKVEVDVP